jgi:hypothetical protein
MKDKEPLDIFIVTEPQLVSINQGKKDIEAGNYIRNEDLNDEVKNRFRTKK